MSTTWTCIGPVLPPALDGLGVEVAAFRKVSGAGYRRVEPATLDIVMVLGVRTQWQVAAPSEAFGTFQAFAAGLAMQPYEVTSPDPAACIEIRLPPTVARDLFRATLSQTDGIVDIIELLGPDAGRLVEKVASARAPREVIMDVVRVLAARMSNDPPLAKPEIRWAWRHIAQTEGRMSIRALADEIGWSERHFTACFRNDIGLAPKAAARLARFSAAHRRVTQSGDALASIATDTGYSDQSHMSREFRALAGAAPAAIRRTAGKDVAIRGETLIV